MRNVARVPKGLPTGGRFTGADRLEGPRLRLVALNPPGLDAADAQRFADLDDLIVEHRPLSALDKMTYDRLASIVDAHLDPDDFSDRVHLPDCLGCERAWGTGRRCFVCCDTYGDPLPLRMRVTSRLRLGGDLNPSSRTQIR